jgi:diacylglycerol kinase family enzyme
MDQKWVAIQRNPRAGSGRRRTRLREFIRELKTRGITPRLFSDRGRLDERLQQPEFRENLVCVVAAGGDGTISDVVNRHPDLPLAVLPLGTENLLARHLKIRCSGKAVAEMIAAGNTRRLDLGRLGKKRFVQMVSVGFDADVIHRLHAERSGTIGKLSYLQPIWQSLRRYQYPQLRLTVDDQSQPLTGRLLVISNLPEYAFHLPVVRSACGDDGQLDVRLFERGSAFQMMRYVGNVLLRRHEKLADVTVARGSKFRIESDTPAPIQIDGDPAGWTPVDISVLPGALQVFVPADGSAHSN